MNSGDVQNFTKEVVCFLDAAVVITIAAVAIDVTIFCLLALLPVSSKELDGGMTLLFFSL